MRSQAEQVSAGQTLKSSGHGRKKAEHCLRLQISGIYSDSGGTVIQASAGCRQNHVRAQRNYAENPRTRSFCCASL